MVKSLKIGAHKYKIELKRTGSLWGHTDHEKHVIAIDNQATTPREKQITAFHEVIHALIGEYGVDYYFRSLDCEEAVVRILETAIVQFLLENKAFSREFIKKALSD